MAAVTMVTACGPEIRIPSQGGAPWVEVTSAHFTLWTDVSAARGRELVREMERRREVIVTAMNHTESKTRVFALALRDRFELIDSVGLRFSYGWWSRNNPIGQPGLVFDVDATDRSHAINNSLAHVFSEEISAAQPAWFSEGIGAYFEMLEVTADHGEIEIGAPRPSYLGSLQLSSPLGSSDLFACTHLYCRNRTLFDSTSWAVLAFLLERHEPAFSRYVQRFNELWRQQPETPWYEQVVYDPAVLQAVWRQRAERRVAAHETAWREAFPELSPAKLDRALLGWLDEKRLHLPRIQFTMPRPALAERALGEADVLAVRSFLTLTYQDDLAAVRRDAAGALAIDPTHVLARLIQAALAHTISRADAAATAAAHPDDWRAQRLVELAFQDSPEASMARARTCTLSQGTAPECARSPDSVAAGR